MAIHRRNPMRQPLLLLACSAFLLIGAVAHASVGAKPPQVKLELEKYTLPNGLEVILHEDHSLPLVAVNIWYHTGPANERAGQTGFAHLFEHLMFQSSGHVPEDSYFKYL
jgi:zinc protease